MPKLSEKEKEKRAKAALKDIAEAKRAAKDAIKKHNALAKKFNHSERLGLASAGFDGDYLYDHAIDKIMRDCPYRYGTDEWREAREKAILKVEEEGIKPNFEDLAKETQPYGEIDECNAGAGYWFPSSLCPGF